MANSNYWDTRQEQLNRALESDEEELKKRLAEYYENEERRLEKEIAAYYSAYGENNVLEYRQLLQQLSDADKRLLMEQMDQFAQKYPEYAHLMPVRESIYRLDRLEGLQYSVQMQQLEMGVKEEELVRQHLEQQAQRAFQSVQEAIGAGSTFNAENRSIIEAVVNTRWANGKNFSERIWAHREHLADVLNEKIAAGFARGDSYQKLVREIRDRFGVGYREAYRLIYTEGTFVMNESRARASEGVYETYILSTVGDSKVCEVCESIQDETEAEPVRFDQRIAGENFPPLHPWCRCSFIIADPDKTGMEDKDSAKDIDQSSKGPEPLSRAYVNHKDQLYNNLQNVDPIDGFEDFGVHGVPEESKIEYETTNGVMTKYTAKEFAVILRNDPTYNGGNIRLLSCGAGSKRSDFAQELANELNVDILAPTETLWTSEHGDLFISDNDILADMWYNDGKIDHSIQPTGHWETFYPRP